MRKSFLAVSLAALLSAGVAVAQSTAPSTTPSTGMAPAPTAGATTGTAGELHAGEIIGADVTNSTGENIGEVKDLVIGADNKVSAAIVSVGGFLGVGDKLVSIALSDLSIKTEQDGDYTIMASATKEQLQAMPEVKLD